MKKSIGIVVVVLLLVLTGCGGKKSKAKVTEKSSETTGSTSLIKTATSTTSKEKTAASTTASVAKVPEVKKAAPWNDTKKAALNQFMGNWGASMGQTYKEYGKGNNVNYYGLDLPDKVLNNEIALVVDDQKVAASWSPDGVTGDGQKIVDVYCDADSVKKTDFPEIHLYLFTVFENKPHVLVGLESGYYERHAVNFKETENQELKNGFSEIMAMDEAATTTSAAAPESTPATSSVPKVEGYTDQEVLAAEVWLDLFKDQAFPGVNYFKIEQVPAGTPFVPANGSVAYPKDTTRIYADSRSDTLAFSDNGDGSVTFYPLPNSYPTDAAKLKTVTQQILDTASRVSFEDVTLADITKLLQMVQK